VGRDLVGWSEEAKGGVREAIRESCEGLGALVGGLEGLGERTGDMDQVKRMFIKEHINWMLDPVAETRYLHPSSTLPRATEPWVVSSSGIEKSLPGSTASPPPPPSSPSSASTITTKSPLNPTVLPDAFLHRLTPTFLIRNPVLTFPSLLRTSIANEGLDQVLAAAQEEEGAGFDTYQWECTFHWSRMMYEFYAAKYDEERRDGGNGNGDMPIILDANDLSNEYLMKSYAVAVGLDPSVLRWEWEKASDNEIEALDDMERSMKGTILRSTGIMEEKMGGVKELELEEEVQRWKGEFGEMLARRLEGLVRDARVDYEWLWERRFRG
jgi:hypothetical protein